MTTNFKRLPVKEFPQSEVKQESVEQLYWNEFGFPTVVKEFSAINHVHISPVEPYNSMVTCSGKVQIFQKSNNEVLRTSSRSKEHVYGARFRNDGKLMVTGGETGLVQVLDAKSRAILRNLKGHTGPARVCSFGLVQTKVFSASDDKTVRQWDLPTEKEITSIKAATDFIRCGCQYPKNADQFITGSYDHMVKLWDFRTPDQQEVISLDHDAPVESVVMHSAGGICVSSGSNFIKVWDIAAGGRMLFKFSNHQKTVTTLCFDGEGSRLLSGSLDRNVKVHNVFDYSVVATLKYPSPILAMDISKDDNYLVVGMADGAISLQTRTQNQQNDFTGPQRSSNYRQRRLEQRLNETHLPMELKKSKQKRGQPGSMEYRARGADVAIPLQGDVVVKDMVRVREKMNKLDSLLRLFRYREAFAIAVNREDNVIISLLTELDRRDALDIAMKEQKTKTLNKFVDFLSRNLSNTNYTKILQPVSSLLLDIYMPLMVKDKTFLNRLQKLNKKLKEDLTACKEMMKLLGVIEQVYVLSKPPPKRRKERKPQFINETDEIEEMESDSPDYESDNPDKESDNPDKESDNGSENPDNESDNSDEESDNAENESVKPNNKSKKTDKKSKKSKKSKKPDINDDGDSLDVDFEIREPNTDEIVIDDDDSG